MNQKELDELLGSWNQDFSLEFWTEPTKDIPINKDAGCIHDWEWYEGIMEKYHFCKHCDEKKA